MKFLCLILLFLIIASIAHSQSHDKAQFGGEKVVYIAYYNQTSVSDSTNPELKHNELFRLDISNKKSLFQSVGNYLADSLNEVFQNLPFSEGNLNLYSKSRTSLPGSSNRYKIYKNRIDNSLTFCETLGKKSYAYIDTFPINNWKLINKFSPVLGYSCQKALLSFRGRDYVAWFTREIPVSDGPYKFYGLPGLIVKLNDINDNYVFELKKFGKLNKDGFIASPTKIIMTTRAAVTSGKKNYYSNLANMVASMAGQKPLTPAELENAKIRIKRKFNNSIELH